MNLQLQDKHVLITGGSKGIGFACARTFLQEGCRVTLVSRSIENLENAKNKLCEENANAQSRIHLYSADLQDAAQAVTAIEAIEEKHGAIHILVNSAGAAKRTPPDELDAAKWHDAMQAKFFSYIHVIDPLIKKMAQRGEGAILNIVGQGGKVASATHLAGGSANAALMLASAGLAAAYGRTGVRINAINPGLTLTDRLQEGLKAEAKLNGITPEEALQHANDKISLGRIALPEEIADAAVFLCSARASYISGVILSMDGATVPMVV